MEVIKNPCDSCKFKNVDWKKIDEFKECESNPCCGGCRKKEIYEQSLRPIHRVEVDLADNEVLVKYTIKDMQEFLGRIVQLTNYVCATPIEVSKEITDAVLEDSIYSALEETEKDWNILDSPVLSEKYNGEYQEVYSKYLADKTEKIVNGFYKNNI